MRIMDYDNRILSSERPLLMSPGNDEPLPESLQVCRERVFLIIFVQKLHIHEYTLYTVRVHTNTVYAAQIVRPHRHRIQCSPFKVYKNASVREEQVEELIDCALQNGNVMSCLFSSDIRLLIERI